MQSKEHWERVYAIKSATEVSWFQEHARCSFHLIARARAPKDAGIIDVGGGASTLVDDLVEQGYLNVTVLDLSETALEVSKNRLGANANNVTWVVDDITKVELPPNSYDIWHDRAVFHFLITREQRNAYVHAVRRMVKPGGHVIIATFAEDGPEKCSGLPVIRYSADELSAEFGAPFTFLRQEREEHRTPFGTTQKFLYCLWRREVS